MEYFNSPSMEHSNPDLIERLWVKKDSRLPMLYKSEYGDMVFFNIGFGILKTFKSSVDYPNKFDYNLH